MLDWLIQEARLADRDGFWDVGVAGGRIAFVRPSCGRETAAGRRVFAAGRLLLPGLVDAHVHTRDPGYPWKEDFGSASRAAAAGGVTTILAMPNTNPPMTGAAAIQMARREAEKKSVVSSFLVGGACASRPQAICGMKAAGAVALDVYDDLFGAGTETWLSMFLEAKKEGLPLCFYLMDGALERFCRERLRARGKAPWEVIAGATDAETEAASIARIFPLAAYLQAPAVIRMVSTKKAVELIRCMKRLYPDAPVCAEACLSYLFLTREDFRRQGAAAHVHPPLRGEEDVRALWEGLFDGTLDYIASDHAPHAQEEKERPKLEDCASGIAGLEVMLPLLLDAAKRGEFGLSDLIRLCCEAPARIYGLSGKGAIGEGMDADLVLADWNGERTVPARGRFTRGAATPYAGRRLTGWPVFTMCRGRLVFGDGTPDGVEPAEAGLPPESGGKEEEGWKS